VNKNVGLRQSDVGGGVRYSLFYILSRVHLPAKTLTGESPKHPGN